MRHSIKEIGLLEFKDNKVKCSCDACWFEITTKDNMIILKCAGCKRSYRINSKVMV